MYSRMRGGWQGDCKWCPNQGQLVGRAFQLGQSGWELLVAPITKSQPAPCQGHAIKFVVPYSLWDWQILLLLPQIVYKVAICSWGNLPYIQFTSIVLPYSQSTNYLEGTYLSRSQSTLYPDHLYSATLYPVTYKQSVVYLVRTVLKLILTDSSQLRVYEAGARFSRKILVL